MATIRWIGGTIAVAQLETGSIDTVDGTPADNTFTVTIGGVAISQVGDTDVATTAAALVVLLNASTHPYFAAITWANPSAGTITGTADTAGVPFTAALTETGIGTGTVTDFVETTANDGPNVWDTADNWEGGVLPGAADEAVLENNSDNIFWNIEGIAALNSLQIKQSYTGLMGLNPDIFQQGETSSTESATEYRDTYMRSDIDTVDIGEHSGPGSPGGSKRIKIHNDIAGAATITVHDTGASTEDSAKPAIRFLFANASVDLIVLGARAGIGIATDKSGETSTMGDITFRSTSPSDSITLGAGVTWTNFTQFGGANFMNGAADVTLVLVENGSLTIEGSEYNIATLTQNGGSIIENHIDSGGAIITTLNLNGGTFDATGINDARTITTLNIESPSTLRIDPDTVTITTRNLPADQFQLVASSILN